MVRPVLKPSDVVEVKFDVQFLALAEVVGKTLQRCFQKVHSSSTAINLYR